MPFIRIRISIFHSIHQIIHFLHVLLIEVQHGNIYQQRYSYVYLLISYGVTICNVRLNELHPLMKIMTLT